MNINTSTLVKTILMFAEILKEGAEEADVDRVIDIADDICRKKRQSAELHFTSKGKRNIAGGGHRW